MDFEYDCLSASASKRLLKVLPTKLNDLIQIQLWQESDAVPYRCLSYTWGAPTPVFPINVNGRTMYVGKNLCEFLDVAVERFANELLWIDAICINQKDDTEKSVQVQRMGDTFKEATEVFVWLGNDESIARLFGKARNYTPPERLSKSLREPAIRLAVHDYWKRAWLIQELALARVLRLLCGSSETTIDQLKTCCDKAGLFDDTPSIPIWQVVRFCDRMNVPFMNRLTSKWALRLSIPSLFRFIQQNPGIVSYRPPFSVWSLVGRKALCTDTRDRLYSILAITGHAKTFEVNYRESVVETFWRAAKYFLAWHSRARLRTLWSALGLDRKAIEAVVNETRGIGMHCSIPLRRCRLVSRFCRGFRHQLCELETSFHPSIAMQGSERDEMWLCPYINQETSGSHIYVSHFSLSPTIDGPKGFAIRANIPFVLRGFSLSEHSELWSYEEGVSARVTTWKEVLRITALGGGADRDWRTKPHLVLRTNQHYVICMSENGY